VSVPLRGLEIAVTQQLLHRAQVGTPVEQVRGEGVAECVRVGGDGGAPVEDAADVAGSEDPTAVVEEDGSGW
jgi:hypothetical protein